MLSGRPEGIEKSTASPFGIGLWTLLCLALLPQAVVPTRVSSIPWHPPALLVTGPALQSVIFTCC